MFDLAWVSTYPECKEISLDMKARSRETGYITAAKNGIKIRYWNANPTQIYVIPRTNKNTRRAPATGWSRFKAHRLEDAVHDVATDSRASTEDGRVSEPAMNTLAMPPQRKPRPALFRNAVYRS